MTSRAMWPHGRTRDRLRLLTLLDDVHEDLRAAHDLAERAEWPALRGPLGQALEAVAEAHRRVS